MRQTRIRFQRPKSTCRSLGKTTIRVSTPLIRRIPREFLALLALLAAMLALMWQPMREEVATFDEPLFLASGYTHLKGMGLHIDPEQPPLAKEWSALPLLFMDVK